MKELEQLKEIGIKRIAQETKIATNRIEDILNKNFENIRRVHFVGFLQILEREYKLDLKDLLSEYDAFFRKLNAPAIKPKETEEPDSASSLFVENTESKQIESKQPKSKPFKMFNKQDKPKAPKLHIDTEKTKYDKIDNDNNQKSQKKLFLITIIFVAILLAVYFIAQAFLNNDKTEAPESKTIEVKTMDNAHETPIFDTIDEIETKEIESKDLDSNANENGFNTDLSANINESSTTTQQIIANTESKPEIKQETKQDISPAIKDDEINISALNNITLWFSISDLDTNKLRYEGVTNKSYSIKTGSNRLLLAFGHRNLTLSINGENIDIPQNNYPIYFIYEPSNGVKRIEPSTYKKLAEQIR